MDNIKFLFNFTILSLFLLAHGANRWKSLSKEEDMETDKVLTTLNKSPIKSFKPNGGIYDCIHIYKQPGLDHPLLKNHKIQMKPTYQPGQLVDQSSSSEKFMEATLESVNCPKGTIPLRRTRKEDLIRAKYFSENYSTNINPQISVHSNQHSVALIPSEKYIYYGAHAIINVQSLQLTSNQYSSAQMWIERGPLEEHTSLQAGWMVSPPFNGNNDTRLFIFWTTDNSETGCYNHNCPGFIQVHPSLGPSSRILNISVYGGKQFVVAISIFQDKTTENWWLQYGGVPIGYWAKSIIPRLNEGASFVAWGGSAAGLPDEESPPMGNGHFPEKDSTRACYMKRIHTYDAYNQPISPNKNTMKIRVDTPNCYNLKYYGLTRDYGHAFLFGGPGGNCGV